MSRDMVAARVAAGRLRPLHRGVHAWGHDRLRPEGLLMAAVLACGRGAVASHHSAAAHLELLSTARRDHDVTVKGRGTRAAHGNVVTHVARRLDQRDVTVHRGIPTTNVARTIVDLAADRLPRHAERALERAYELRLLAPDELEAAVSRAPGRRTRVLWALMEREGPPTPARNDLEEALLAASRAAGIPDPEVNVPLLGYVPDFLWRDRKLIVETDGFGSHGARRAFEHDRRRDVRLALAGFRVARFTYDQVMGRPGETVRLLAELYRGQ